MALLGSRTWDVDAGDPVNNRMRSFPTTVVSNTPRGPFDWPDATLATGDAVDAVARLKEESAVPLRSAGAADFDLELLDSRTLDGRTQELVHRPVPHV